MYFLSVGAIFRNESHCIQEWIEHYLRQGVEHFYLINDNSTDNSVELLNKYTNITLFHSNEEHVLGHQLNAYNKYILPHLKETKWMLICDLDEFVYSQIHKTIPDFLKCVPNLSQVQVTPTIFGSNNLEKQPKSLIHGFTKRTKMVPSDCGTYKYFVNSDFEFESLNVHHATPKNHEHFKGEYFQLFNIPHLKLNHYICQSKEFWINVKCTRGDADGYLKRDMELFDNYNSTGNEEDDFELSTISS
jgi:glycosyltransferase involved in cell wall biosynthesis